MLICKKCGVDVSGAPVHCPLCQGDLFGTPESEHISLPAIDVEKTTVSALKVISAVLIVLSIIAVGLNSVILTHLKWSLLVVLGLCCLWVCAYVFLQYKRNVIKNIFLQAMILIILACSLDNATGYHKWANSYVVPIILIITIVSIQIIARVQRLNIGDYLFYFIFNCVVGVYSFRYTMYATQQITVVVPTAICFIVSLSAIVLTLLFEHKLLLSELRRRIHF